jgi:hypothetical protein
MIVKKIKTNHRINFSASIYATVESESDTIDGVISYKTKSLAKFNIYENGSLKYKSPTFISCNLDDIQKECRKIMQRKLRISN